MCLWPNTTCHVASCSLQIEMNLWEVLITLFVGLLSMLQCRAEWRATCRGIEEVLAGKERERNRGVTVVRPHCYQCQLSHRSITLFIQVSSIPVTISHGLSQRSLNFTDQWILRKGLKAWNKSFLLSFPRNCSHENEQAWIIIQNNDSFLRCKCCGDCITSIGYDKIFKHSSSLIYALTKSCFQLEDVTLPLKHVWNRRHTKPLLLRCLCMLRCKASVAFLATFWFSQMGTLHSEPSIVSADTFCVSLACLIWRLLPRHKGISASPLLSAGRDSSCSSIVLI